MNLSASQRDFTLLVELQCSCVHLPKPQTLRPAIQPYRPVKIRVRLRTHGGNSAYAV
jgi:hypothetical protein